MSAKKLSITSPFTTEGGAVLPGLDITYFTYGKLSPQQDNVVWIAHALTASADAAAWWPGLVGPGKLLDPERYYIVCANVIGSCYGSTGPTSNNPETGQPYGLDFPLITIRDMVRAHQLLQEHLGIRQIYLGIGGSMGGQQLLEWAAQQPRLFSHLALLATNAQHSPWGIAFNESQRMALLADDSIRGNDPKAGARGLEAARAMAILSYRHYDTFATTQTDDEPDKLEGFRAGSYQRYQGQKLQKRFSAHAYYALTRSMDTHHIGRGRGNTAEVLSGIRAKTLVIAIDSDILFPPLEQQFIAAHIPGARLATISSLYGHDGFLVEYEAISSLLSELLSPHKPQRHGFLKVRPRPGYSAAGIPALPGMETI